MAPRKRGRDEMEASEPDPEPSVLDKLRNMWEFANLMQYIFIFGDAVKIDKDLDIEDLEQECLKPESSKVLSDIGLCLLKFVSSHRGLTPEIFDEYTRRQYTVKAPHLNPFGVDEEPRKFTNFDIFTKIRVLVQLSQWTLLNPDRMREKMPDTKDSEQASWRVEEIGYDRHDRNYYVLDDNRLYRRTNPPPPPVPAAKPKANTKKAKAAARSSKRRKTRQSIEEYSEVESGVEGENDDGAEAQIDSNGAKQDAEDTFGGFKWACIAISLQQYKTFLEPLQKTRDPNEKVLYQNITEGVLPVIEKAEESLARKKQRRERELLNMQRMAGAKRSSRLEAKLEREKQEQEAAEEEKKRREDLVAAKRDQARQKQMEKDRQSRMLTREQRLKDREYKRILHQEELANLAEENRKVEAGESRGSERHLKAEMEKKKKDLEALQEEDAWFFDCSKCGVHGSNVDDGSHSVACERCNVWQHSACLGISMEDAEKDDFHFICQDCKQREEDVKKPKIPTLKFHFGSSATNGKDVESDIAQGEKRKSMEDKSDASTPKKVKLNNKPKKPKADLNGQRPPLSEQNVMHQLFLNGPKLSPHGQQTATFPAPLYAGNTSPPADSVSQAKAPGYITGNYGYTGRQSASKSKSSPPQGRDQPFSDQQPTAQPSPGGPYASHHLNLYPQNHYSTPQPQSGTYQPYHNTFATLFSSYQPRPDSQSNQPYQPPAKNESPRGPKPGVQPQVTTSQTASSHQRSVPSAQDPFANSFKRLPSQQSPKQNLPPALQKAPTLSPPQQQKVPVSQTNGVNPAPVKSNDIHFSSTRLNSTPQINGLSTPHIPLDSALPPTGPSAHSPAKNPSPPTSFAHPAPASSPIINQPPLRPTNAPSSPGISPQKHNSPSSHHEPGAHGNVDENPILSPAPKLSPSSAHFGTTSPPLKSTSNGVMHQTPQPVLSGPLESPKLAPSLLPYESEGVVKKQLPLEPQSASEAVVTPGHADPKADKSPATNGHS